MSRHSFDEDALVAAADLVRRSGASQFEVGYVHENVPLEEAGWYAQAMYQGRRVIKDDRPGPIEAAEALARNLLNGAMCRRCGETIILAGDEKGCRWTRMGRRWEPGCGKEIDQSIPIRK